jgi:hypothetical protein
MEETDIVTASDVVSGDNFGLSVALSGSNGKAYVFTRSLGLDFEEKELLQQGVASGFDRFGSIFRRPRCFKATQQEAIDLVNQLQSLVIPR